MTKKGSQATKNMPRRMPRVRLAFRAFLLCLLVNLLLSLLARGWLGARGTCGQRQGVVGNSPQHQHWPLPKKMAFGAPDPAKTLPVIPFSEELELGMHHKPWKHKLGREAIAALNSESMILFTVN